MARSVLRVLTSDRVHRFGGFLIRICLSGGLGMLWLMETVRLVSEHPREVFGVLCLIPALAAIALVLFPEGHLPKWAAPVAGLSLAASLGCVLLQVENVPMLSETGAMLILLAWTVRRITAPLGTLSVVLLVAALLFEPLRLMDTRIIAVNEVLIVVSGSVAAIVGAYLHSVDARRRRAISTVRHGERLELARELHDFVAHHVTGMVVQAQAAQYLSDDDPAKTRESFAAIERAGIESLTSMRRLVEVMREPEAEAGARPLGDLAQTAELVDRFENGDAITTLYVSPDLAPDAMPPELAASIHRIVQEGLTNVRKHATGVTAVTVAIATIDNGVELAVRNDGRIASGGLGFSGGGFGLEGLHERATAIGGRLSAGPRPEGGWEVVATFPS